MLRLVTFLSGLSGMEPATDTQPLPTILRLAHDDLLDRVEAVSWLHLEKHELVPHGRDALARDRFGLGHTFRARPDRVQLERAAPLALPTLVVRERHVEDVRDAAGPDDVVVVEQMAALAVADDGHVLLRARERAAAGDRAQEGAKHGRVERIAQREQRRQERDLLQVEEVERREVAGLVDLIR